MRRRRPTSTVRRPATSSTLERTMLYPFGSRCCVLAAFVSSCWLLGLGPLAGPAMVLAQADDEPVVHGEVVDVFVVNVEVRVTDRQGRPVTGLEQSAFTLREDRKPVEISNFWEVPPRLPTSASNAETHDEAEDPIPANMIFLIDDFVVEPSNRRLVLGELRQLLKDGVKGTTQVALAVYDGDMKVVQQPTADSAQLQAAVDRLQEIPAIGVTRLRQRQIFQRDVLTRVGEAKNEVRAGVLLVPDAVARLNGLLREVQLESDRIRSQNGRTYLAMGALIDGLATLPGRKALVYLSEGLALRPGEAEYQVIQDALREVTSGPGGGDVAADIDSRSAALGALSDQAAPPPNRRRRKSAPPDELFAVTALAANARVSFYPWKARGQVGGVAAEIGGEAALGTTVNVQSTREASLVESLSALAQDTGGDFVVGGALAGLVEEAVADFGGYYSLGFSPQHGGDDQLHELKVKVKGRGLKVWYPKSYVARVPEPVAPGQ